MAPNSPNKITQIRYIFFLNARLNSVFSDGFSSFLFFFFSYNGNFRGFFLPNIVHRIRLFGLCFLIFFSLLLFYQVHCVSYLKSCLKSFLQRLHGITRWQHFKKSHLKLIINHRNQVPYLLDNL